MSETTPIPEEVMLAARAVVERGFNEGLIVAVARALLARDERAAKFIEAYMLCEDASGSEVLWPRSNPGNKVGLSYASAIRDRSKT